MISKELLSLVLGERLRRVMFDANEVKETYDEDLNHNECLIVYETCGYSSYSKYNIHELAHKCKEWAYDNRYEIGSFYTEHTYQSDNEANGEEPKFKSIKQALVRVIHMDNHSRKVLNHYYERTEPEAIFKACQWIKDNEN